MIRLFTIQAFLNAIFILSVCFANAQTTIKGIVQNKTDRKGISGVNVTVKDKKSAAILTYALTDEKGMYQLNFTSNADSLMISVSGFNIEKESHTLINRNQLLNFDINPQAIKLKEIKVNPPKIRRLNDTISYLVDGFKDNNDRTIGDVLRKMPGIEVKPDGSILYNNKPINKFYIEDRDLLQGRYGIATNNIEAKDVASVQVLENHQPIKALKNREFTDDAALNLKLKDNAKGVLIANAKIGAGLSPLLWNNELFSMYFNKGRQNMNTYKGNNTGSDPGSDLNSYYRDANKTSGKNSLSVQSPSTPAISQNRYLFNRAHAFSINNLWTSGKENQINANMSFLNDRQEKSSFSRSIYYLPADSVLKIEESLASKEIINQLDASFQYNTNKDNYYLDNLLTFKGTWNRTYGTAIQADTVFQQLKNPAYNFANTLNLVRNFKKYSFKIYSYIAYNKAPQTLHVQPLLYDALFENPENLSTMRQELTLNRFTSSNRLSFGSTSDTWKQNYTIGISANLQQFQSALRGQSSAGSLSTATDSLSNDLQWNKYQVYFSPDYTFIHNDFRASVNMPVSYNKLQTNDQLTQQNKNINRLYLNPTLSVKYDFSLFLALAATASYTDQLGEINNVFTGFIMQSYRNLIRNEGQLPEQQNQNYTIDLHYRHPLHSIFLNIGSQYFRNRNNLLYGYDYQGILSIKKTYDIPNIAEGFSFNGRLSKGIDVIAGTLTLEANYMNTNSSQISQNELVNYKNETFLLKPGFNTKIKSWASLRYEFQFTKSKNTIRNGTGSLSPIRANNQYVQLNLFPVKGLTINLAHEYFYSSTVAAESRVMSFADAGLKYKYKNMEFSLDYTNIFNAKQYISAGYSDISTYYSAYNLRPAQVLIGIRFKIK